MIFGSQKIHSGSIVGMDQNGANLSWREQLRAVYSTSRKMLTSPTREITEGMDRRVTI